MTALERFIRTAESLARMYRPGSTLSRLLLIVKKQKEALDRLGAAASFVGYAFDGNHQPKALFDEMALRRKYALDTMSECERLCQENLSEDSI